MRKLGQLGTGSAQGAVPAVGGWDRIALNHASVTYQHGVGRLRVHKGANAEFTGETHDAPDCPDHDPGQRPAPPYPPQQRALLLPRTASQLLDRCHYPPSSHAGRRP